MQASAAVLGHIPKSLGCLLRPRARKSDGSCASPEGFIVVKCEMRYSLTFASTNPPFECVFDLLTAVTPSRQAARGGSGGFGPPSSAVKTRWLEE